MPKGVPSKLKGVPSKLKRVPFGVKGIPSGLKKVPFMPKGIPFGIKSPHYAQRRTRAEVCARSRKKAGRTGNRVHQRFIGGYFVIYWYSSIHLFFISHGISPSKQDNNSSKLLFRFLTST